ncbi:WD repeat containing protein 3 [Echinococcus multilocularis]|uniref:WD repeat containing protein 3 n=1 Tax=Echinococcus multilocularis TaxID=6211 RepID=A0A068YAU0_ECHMU|nr:WD repeat containing protein 3 [Echinococcus multilocularis]
MDGWVTVFSLHSGKEEASFRAGSHRVTSLDISGSSVACASESELHILDIISGGGYRLKGHRGAVTSVKVIPNNDILISGGRDTFIRFWCLKTQHCFLTLTGHPGPVWDVALSANCKILVTGSSDTNLRLWKIKYNNRIGEKGESDFLNVSDAQRLIEDNLAQSVPLADYSSLLEIEFRGTIPRKSVKRVFSLTFDPSGRYLACQTLDKVLEIFVLLSEAERQSRLRKKQKKARKLGSIDPSAVKLTAEDELCCIYQIALPAKLSSCDIRVSHFNPMPRETEDRPHISILHILCSYRNNLVEEYSLKVPVTLPTRPVLLSGCVSRLPEAKQKAMAVESTGCELRLAGRISNLGHRAFPLSCQITEDGFGVFTLAHGEGKLWNRLNQTCLTTIDWSSVELKSTPLSGEDISKVENEAEDDAMMSRKVSLKSLKATAFVLAPGSRHVAIGFESGLTCLFDLITKKCTQTLANAHTGAVRSLILTGDRKGIISGGADSKVGFWNFDLNVHSKSGPSLYLKSHRPVQSVADQVTALATTPDNRLIAVAMVNLHVDIYFTDSFKRVHSLYGMSAPVSCMDVSEDSRLLLTGSGDKTVRLWELQFGNCVRRFVQHTDPITAVRFMHGSTLAFSADLGGIIREWDVKKLQEVCVLKGHEGGITGLATLATRPGLGKLMRKNLSRAPPKRKRSDTFDVASAGEGEEDDFEADICGGVVISTGRDFSCRVWCESEEPLVLEEEAELAREAAEDEHELARYEAIVPGAVAPEAGETGPLGRPTVTTRNAADSLMEAIDIYTRQTQSENESEPPHPLMVAYGVPDDPDRFLFTIFSSLRLPASGGMSGLEHALGCIHSDHVTRLLPRLAAWMGRGWDIELCGRALRYLCTLHAALVTADTNLTSTLAAAVAAKRSHLSQTKKMLGMNLAALDLLQRKIEEENQISLFEEATSKRVKRIKKIKEKIAKRAAVSTG